MQLPECVFGSAEYCVSESECGRESVTGKASSKGMMGKWASAFSRKKSQADAASAQPVQPLPPSHVGRDGMAAAGTTEIGVHDNHAFTVETEEAEEADVYVSGIRFLPPSMNRRLRMLLSRISNSSTSDSHGITLISYARHGVRSGMSGIIGWCVLQHVTCVYAEKEAGSLNPQDIVAAHKATLARAKGARGSSKVASAPKKSTWVSKAFGRKEVDPAEEEAEKAAAAAAAADFRAQRGHDWEELYVEKPVVEVEAEPVDEEAMAAAAAEEEFKRKFGGSSRHQDLYVLCKSDAAKHAPEASKLKVWEPRPNDAV